MKPTPRPWSVGRSDVSPLLIHGPGGPDDLVADLEVHGDAEGMSRAVVDADLIVAAVNAYDVLRAKAAALDGLLAAARLAVEMLGTPEAADFTLTVRQILKLLPQAEPHHAG